MSEMKWAIITGADGGMGTEITRAVAKAGYRIIMACYHPQKAEVVRTNGKCELHGTLSAYPEINSVNGAWSAYRKYGFLYIRNRQARLPRFLS